MKSYRSYFKNLANTITGSCAVAAKWGHWNGAHSGMRQMVMDLPPHTELITARLISVGAACGDTELNWKGTAPFPVLMAELVDHLARTSPRHRYLVIKDENGEWSWGLKCPASHSEWQDETPRDWLVQFINYGR